MNDFDDWSTEKLGELIVLMRLRAREARSAFQRSEQEDRRKRKHVHSFETERTETYARRLDDDLEAMQVELRRRTIAAVVTAELGEMM